MNLTVYLPDELHYTEDNIALLAKYFIFQDDPGEAHIIFTRPDQPTMLPGDLENLRFLVSNSTRPPPTPEGIEAIWLTDNNFLQHITSTAEHTLGLILAAHRNIIKAHGDVLSCKLSRYEHGAPRMLSRSVLTIVGGYGRVGRHLAIRAKPLFKTIHRVEKWTDFGEIDWILRETDVLAICASYDPEVGPAVTSQMLSLLPQNAIVVNTSVGENLDHEALLERLREGHLRGAALDVLPYEPQTSEFRKTWSALTNYAFEHKNLILTPHIAGSTWDAWAETQRWVIEELIRRTKR